MDITNSLSVGLAVTLIYKERMTHRFMVFLLPFLLGPTLAFATCENVLRTEFGRTPDDTDEGKITEEIEIDTDSLTAAYAHGIFPWAVNERGKGVWHSPSTRGFLDLNTMEIPRGDRKAIRKLIESGKYEVRVDTAFRQVIQECATQMRYRIVEENGVKVKKEANRWITDTHIEEFTNLYLAGRAHSVEVWEGDQLVGGLYGVFVNGYFSGESMFHKAPDVTKLAYSYLIDRLKANGHFFIDTQQNLGLTNKWGGQEISREEFLRYLGLARELNRPF